MCVQFTKLAVVVALYPGLFTPCFECVFRNIQACMYKSAICVPVFLHAHTLFICRIFPRTQRKQSPYYEIHLFMRWQDNLINKSPFFSHNEISACVGGLREFVYVCIILIILKDVLKISYSNQIEFKTNKAKCMLTKRRFNVVFY